MNKIAAVFNILLLLIAPACLSVVQETPTPEVWHCPPLSKAFQESHLIGTWQTEYSPSYIDTLILKEDGTYKQIFARHTDGYRYESAWNQWWLEYRASGGLYLHLDKMRRCDQWDELCYKEGGGGGDWLYWDYCEDRVIRMPDEVVLMVTGVSKSYEKWYGPVPRGIRLLHMLADPDSVPFHFTLQEE